MRNCLLNVVTGGTEKAEIVYEVRDETKDIVVEKGLQKKHIVLQLYTCKNSLLSLHRGN